MLFRPTNVEHITLEGVVINDEETCLSVPEFEVIRDDDAYRIICYHGAGELVKKGNVVSIEGTLMRFADYNIVVLLDPIKDRLRILK